MVKYRRSRFKTTRTIRSLIVIGGVFFFTGMLSYFKNYLYKNAEKFLNGFINTTGSYVKTVMITGASPYVEKLIIENLGVKAGDSIFSVSTMNILKNLSKIGWIKEAIIHKILPNTIKVEIKERIPTAVYHNNKKYTLIDNDGVFIEDTEVNPGLPLISGIDANIRINEILASLRKYPEISIKSLMYVQKRRWNLILKNNVTVKLPGKDVENALKILRTLVMQKNVINVATAIDLRVPGNITVSGLEKKTKRTFRS